MRQKKKLVEVVEGNYKHQVCCESSLSRDITLERDRRSQGDHQKKKMTCNNSKEIKHVKQYIINTSTPEKVIIYT